MNNDALMAWNIVEKTHANLFLTGKAGTGKTTFLKELKQRSLKRMVVLAPTGIAAINAGGMTIHSFLQLPLTPYLPGATYGRSDQRRYRFSKAKRDIIRTIDLLVIDEISMVRSDLLDAVDSVLRRYRRQSDKPFGGVQLLLIGDLQQLAPVVTPSEEQLLANYYDTPYFFSSNALSQAGYLTVELKRVYRQQDEQFVALLNQIRDNKATEATLQQLNQCYRPGFVPPEGSNYIRLTTHNRPAQRINEEQLRALPSVASSFTAEVEGDFPETSFPTDYVLTLKPGAQVMFVKNAPDHRFYNGMIGEVRSIVGHRVTVESKDNGDVFELERMEWTNSKYVLNEATKEIEETVEGTFRQYPVRLAWAITVHKSQGLTFEHAIIDVSHSFTHGQTYVALSRCKTMQGMVLSHPLSLASVISDATIDSFTGRLQSPTTEQLTMLERQYVVHCLDELFGFSPVCEAYDMLMRCLLDHFYRRYSLLLQEYQKMSVVLKSLDSVSQRFRQQYTQMLAHVEDEPSAGLQERIQKGACYFCQQMGVLTELIGKTHVVSESTAVMKQFNDRFSTFADEVRLKERLLRHEADAAFTVPDYLREKALCLLMDGEDGAQASSKRKSRGERTREKAPKAPKEPKVSTKEITLGMLREGKSIGQIATQRNLTRNTIITHLMHYVVEGQLDKRVLLSADHERVIRELLQSHPENTTLASVKDELGDDYEYHEIRLVFALQQREKSQPES